MAQNQYPPHWFQLLTTPPQQRCQPLQLFQLLPRAANPSLPLAVTRQPLNLANLAKSSLKLLSNHPLQISLKRTEIRFGDVQFLTGMREILNEGLLSRYVYQSSQRNTSIVADATTTSSMSAIL
ncbi:hypothetical protein FRC02_009466 [Tulasnella sp. 418]|nr:hypothetical protein FRC02_009466 [Tulasnella sp. 418]